MAASLLASGYLVEENVAGAVAYHAVAGFMGRMLLKTATLVEAGGKLPVVVTFVDTTYPMGAAEAEGDGGAPVDSARERCGLAGKAGISSEFMRVRR